jgi:hypothetical protein
MALARFKDLCIDAADPDVLGPFWAAVLGRTYEPRDGGGLLLGPTPGHTVWLNPVPEEKTVKHRVHLDIYARQLGELEQLGASVLDREAGGGRWTVMADPEGGEFCAFLRAELPDERLHGLVVDSRDPFGAARWWADVYDAELVEHANEGYATVQQVPGMPIETLDFVPVPEPKAVKNRIHWDVTTPALDPLLRTGATVVLAEGEDRGWHVLADPEGNEFCAFVRP